MAAKFASFMIKMPSKLKNCRIINKLTKRSDDDILWRSCLMSFGLSCLCTGEETKWRVEMNGTHGVGGEREEAKHIHTQLSYHLAAELVVCSSSLSVSVQIGSFHFATVARIAFRLFRRSEWDFNESRILVTKTENVNKQTTVWRDLLGEQRSKKENIVLHVNVNWLDLKVNRGRRTMRAKRKTKTGDEGTELSVGTAFCGDELHRPKHKS